MAAYQGKLDRVYQNKPKIFRVNQTGNANGMMNNGAMMNNYMMGNMTQTMPFMQQQFNPQYPPQNMMFDPQYVAAMQNQNPMMMNTNQTFSNPDPNQMYQIQELNEPNHSNSISAQRNSESDDMEQRQLIFQTMKMNFMNGRTPAPPPPPPEMLKALSNMLQTAGSLPPSTQQNQTQFQQNTQQMMQPPYAIPQIPQMLPQSLLRSSNKIKLTSHIYKNQNAPPEPLNPKFIKANPKSVNKDNSKERLYRPNTGFSIEEEEEEKKKIAEVKVFIRGQDDLIQSGVTTERDEDEELYDATTTEGEKKFIKQKFIMQESISESQFKGQVPKIYIDPKNACEIEERKIEEKEKEEEEFQKKKEVFLVKNKYKILVELEKEKSRKLMERLLKKDLDEIESKNREQEILNQLEGEEIRKQRNQAKELEKIVSDIRQERDYKTIKKVLGIDLEKPLDQVIDMEKIKAEYALEEMYKKNEELYEKANNLFEECNYYVDQKGQQHDKFKETNQNLSQIEKYNRKSYLDDEVEEDDNYDTEQEEDEYNQQEDSDAELEERKPSIKFARADSILLHSQASETQINNPSLKKSQFGTMSSQNSETLINTPSMKKSQFGDKSGVSFSLPDRNLSHSQKVRFVKKGYQLTDEERKQREFYLSIQKKIEQAEKRLQEYCEYDSDISIDITSKKNQNLSQSNNNNNGNNKNKSALKQSEPTKHQRSGSNLSYNSNSENIRTQNVQNRNTSSTKSGTANSKIPKQTNTNISNQKSSLSGTGKSSLQSTQKRSQSSNVTKQQSSASKNNNASLKGTIKKK